MIIIILGAYYNLVILYVPTRKYLQFMYNYYLYIIMIWCAL